MIKKALFFKFSLLLVSVLFLSDQCCPRFPAMGFTRRCQSAPR